MPKVVYISQPTYIKVNYNNVQYTLSPYFIQIVNGAPMGSGIFTSLRGDYYNVGDSMVSCSFNDKTVSWYNFFMTYGDIYDRSINMLPLDDI